MSIAKHIIKSTIILAALYIITIILLLPIYLLDCITLHPSIDVLIIMALIVYVARAVLRALTYPRSGSHLRPYPPQVSLFQDASHQPLWDYSIPTDRQEGSQDQDSLPPDDPLSVPEYPPHSLQYVLNLHNLAQNLDRFSPQQYDHLLSQILPLHAQALQRMLEYYDSHTPEALRLTLSNHYSEFSESCPLDLLLSNDANAISAAYNYIADTTFGLYLPRRLLLSLLTSFPARPSPPHVGSLCTLLLFVLRRQFSDLIRLSRLSSQKCLNPTSERLDATWLIPSLTPSLISALESCHPNAKPFDIDPKIEEPFIPQSLITFIFNILLFLRDILKAPVHLLLNLRILLTLPKVNSKSYKLHLSQTAKNPDPLDLLVLPLPHVRFSSQIRLGALGISSSYTPLPRPSGGVVDTIVLAPEGASGSTVLYSNPNAGLYELTLLHLSLPSPLQQIQSGLPALNPANHWIEYYLCSGYSVALYNYSGYSRSHLPPPRMSQLPSLLLGSTPNVLSTLSLVSDGVTCMDHLYNENFIAHGESIGGMVTTLAIAQSLSSHPKGTVILDRTFSDLPSVAQRLIHPALGSLMWGVGPYWNSDVVSSYHSISSSWRIAVAQDVSDQIIHYESSLMTGIGLSTISSKGFVAWKGRIEAGTVDNGIWEEYIRQDDYIAIDSIRSSLSEEWSPNPSVISSAPRLTVKKIRAFCGCVRGFGMKVTKVNRMRRDEARRTAESLNPTLSDSESSGDDPSDDEGEAANLRPQERAAFADVSAMNAAWRLISLCDGLQGLALGTAAKMSRDAVYAWLCNAIRWGPYFVYCRIRDSSTISSNDWSVEDSHFDVTPGYSGRCAHGAIPITEALKGLKQLLSRWQLPVDDSNPAPAWTQDLHVIIMTLQYVVDTIKAKVRSDWSTIKDRGLIVLTVGHNTPWTALELRTLELFLRDGKDEVKR